MPIYEYKCKKCGKVYEILCSLNEKHFFVCDKCHGKLEKIVSLTNFQLKGNGWFKDGYSKNRTKEKQ